MDRVKAREFIHKLYLQVLTDPLIQQLQRNKNMPDPNHRFYRLKKKDFYTNTVSDEDFLLNEETKLFRYFGLTRLRPNAVITDLRQKVIYRPDTYDFFTQFAVVIGYFFAFDQAILGKSVYGNAILERLLTAFLRKPDLFTLQ